MRPPEDVRRLVEALHDVTSNERRWEMVGEAIIPFRRLLFATHPCVGKYGDDGEMQCNACGIDFLRDEAVDIHKRIVDRGLRLLAGS